MFYIQVDFVKQWYFAIITSSYHSLFRMNGEVESGRAK